MGGEIPLALLAVLCAAVIALWLYGRLLGPLPRGRLWMVLSARGDGEGLEQSVRAMCWLRSLGLADWGLVIADVDLTPRGRELALCLTHRWPEVALMPASELPRLMEQDSET